MKGSRDNGPENPVLVMMDGEGTYKQQMKL